MGLLVDGKWLDQWYDTKSNDGKFVRTNAGFRNWVTADGSAGPSGHGGFKAEAGRYHLYVSMACPWAHRTLIFRKLKGLEDMISVSSVNAYMAENGWTFDDGPNVIADPIHQAKYMHQVYTAAQADFTGRVTVPVLWDKQSNSIVSNESSEIIRMFNSAFNDLIDNEEQKQLDFYPESLRTQIDDINERVYHAINNGVYKSGFATTTEAYQHAVGELFSALDEMDNRLAHSRYLLGSQITEADWRLFTTLIRFDAVYVGHFKCNIRRISDYAHLSGYLLELYQIAGIAETVHIDHIKAHYYASHETINPTRIIPVGPDLEFIANPKAKHGRDHL